MDNSSYDTPEKIPVSVLHSFLYCPRLMYFQFVEKVFVDSAETIEGTIIHNRVNQPQNFEFPEEILQGARDTIRSLALQDDELGVLGVADLLKKKADGTWVLYEYKHGKPCRDASAQLLAKAIDKFQVQAYIILARKQGVDISGGAVYYAETRQVVPVELPENDQFLRDAIRACRQCAERDLPLPPDNHPKCLYCSLYSTCMPDETLYWRHQGKTAGSVRPPLPDNVPENALVVISQKGYVSKRGDTIIAMEDGEVKASFPVHGLEGIRIYGCAQLSTQVMQFCMREGVDVSFFTSAGRYIGHLETLGISGLDSRHGQYRIAENEKLSLKIARRIISAKIANQRTFLQRNAKGDVKEEIKALRWLRQQTGKAHSREELMGIEGRAAALYFQSFAKMIVPQEFKTSFEGRNRRPPKDPVNCLLSLGYSTLASELTGICHGVGLDPACGFFHAPRYGRPALALDIMEEFRPLIVDSVVLSLLNRGAIDMSDFDMMTNGCSLRKTGHQAFWAAYGRRMEEELVHPVFHYRMSYRRLLGAQVRQLWRIFRGDVATYHPIITR